MTEAEFVATAGREPTDLERQINGWVVTPEAGTATAGESATTTPDVSVPSSMANDVSDASKSADVSSVKLSEPPATDATAEAPNDAATSPVGSAIAAATAAGEFPNAGATPAEPASTESTQSSAPNASADAGTSPSVASSADPLHVQVAGHLEAIYTLAKDHAEAAAAQPAAFADVKAHVGDVLEKLHNGIGVAEGQLVQKLEALFHML